MTGTAIKTNGLGKPCPEYLNMTVTMAEGWVESPSETMTRLRERRRRHSDRDREYRRELRLAADRAAGLIK